MGEHAQDVPEIRERLVSGSIVHDDYMTAEQEQAKKQDPIDENFVSVDEGDIKQYQKDQQARINVSKTSTKTSDEGQKL